MGRRSKCRGWALVRVAGLLAAAGMGPGAALAQSSPYFLGVAQSWAQEENVLQLANTQPVPAGFQKDDVVATTSLQGGFDQRFGRQRAYGRLTLRDTRFEQNKVFDNQGYNGQMGLEWSTAGRVSGSMSANVGRNLKTSNTDEIGFLSEKNLETVQSLNAGLNVGLVTRYSLDLNANRVQVKNSLDRPDVQAREFVQEGVSLGLQWQPSNALTLGIALGSTRGRYPKFRTVADGFQADRFKRQDVQLNASYRPTGASNLRMVLSSGDTTYDLNEQRNFSGLTGNLNWTWLATGKLSFNTTLARDTGQDSFATAVFSLPATADYSRVNKTVRVQADYAATAKIAVMASVLRYSREVVRTVDNPFVPLTARGTETTWSSKLGFRWSPRHFLQLGCEIGQDRRRSQGELVSDLDGRSFSCSGQIILQ